MPRVRAGEAMTIEKLRPEDQALMDRVQELEDRLERIAALILKARMDVGGPASLAMSLIADAIRESEQ